MVSREETNSANSSSAPLRHRKRLIPLSTTSSSPLHLRGCHGIGSDELIPPLRPDQRHHRLSQSSEPPSCWSSDTALSNGYLYRFETCRLWTLASEHQPYLFRRVAALFQNVRYVSWSSRTCFTHCDKTHIAFCNSSLQTAGLSSRKTLGAVGRVFPTAMKSNDKEHVIKEEARESGERRVSRRQAPGFKGTVWLFCCSGERFSRCWVSFPFLSVGWRVWIWWSVSPGGCFDS